VERLKTKDIAAISERYDAQVQQMTISWKQKQAELKTEKKQIERRLTRQREFVAPVKRLPSEMLSEIFMIQVDCGDSPWTLLRVCRLWRVVASSTPHLWRHIQIAEDRQIDSGTSFQNCFTNSHFEKALSRTGAAPLSISITDVRSYTSDLAAESKRLFALFSTLAKVFDRCDTLVLKQIHRLAEYEELFTTLEFPISSSLRSLRIGWVLEVIVQKLLVALNHKSTALRELWVDTCDHDLVQSLSNYQILLKRLTSFSATDFQVPTNVFAAMRCLSYFSQTNDYLALPQASSATELVQEAQFIGLTFLDVGTRQFTNLRKLVLRRCKIPLQPGAIKAPVLDTLIYAGESWLPVLVFDCPLLSHLELEGGADTKAKAKKEVNQLLGLDGRFVHLKALKIDLVMSDAVLIAILKNLAALEHLSITFQDYRKNSAPPGDTFFRGLLITKSHRLGFLQNLHTLILQSEYSISELGGLLPGLRTGMQRVVCSRQRAAPLRSATLLVMEKDWNGLKMVEKEEFVVHKEEQ